jgi:hypothetical protein
MAAILVGGPTSPSQVVGVSIAVVLIPAVADDLRRLEERTNLSKTDLANRAITSYEFLDAQLNAGNDLLIRNRKTGRTQMVQFL